MATFGASAASGIRKKVEKPAKNGIPLYKKIAQSAVSHQGDADDAPIPSPAQTAKSVSNLSDAADPLAESTAPVRQQAMQLLIQLLSNYRLAADDADKAGEATNE
jgi:hypothetical protein